MHTQHRGDRIDLEEKSIYAEKATIFLFKSPYYYSV